MPKGPKHTVTSGQGMAHVLFTVPLDQDRRDVIARTAPGFFEPIVLEDLKGDSKHAAWAQAEVVVCLGFPSEIPVDLAQRAPRLRLVQTLSAGVDHVPFERIPASVLVCSNAGAYSTSVAEHAMALLLAAAKDVPGRTEAIRSGLFDQETRSTALRGSTILVLGLGGIGREVARLAKTFGMTVLGIRRSSKSVDDADEVGDLADLRSFARRADAIVVCLPLTRDTAGLIDRGLLAAMKEEAILVNIARGKIVVEDDLYEHLRTHPRFRAALDVWWTYPDGKKGHPFHRPFEKLPNVVMTPHVAFANPGQGREAMEAALENVVRFLRGERPQHVVDRREYEG